MATGHGGVVRTVAEKAISSGIASSRTTQLARRNHRYLQRLRDDE